MISYNNKVKRNKETTMACRDSTKFHAQRKSLSEVAAEILGARPFYRRVRKTAKRDYDFRRVLPSAYNSAPTVRIFMKFDI
jgi:hypothetical protein